MASKSKKVRKQIKAATRRKAQSTSLDRFRAKATQFFLLLILLSSLWVILSRRYDESTMKWAIGSTMLVVGQKVKVG